MTLIIQRRLSFDVKEESRPHQHSEGQFVLVKHGYLDGHAENKTWLLNPGMAAWIPPNISHWGCTSSDVELLVLYLPEKQCGDFPKSVRLLTATALMFALCERMIESTQTNTRPRRTQCMLYLLKQEICEADAAGIIIPLPRDPRLKSMTDMLMESPALRLSLSEWGRRIGATERTLTRLFRRETGLRYTDWHARLLLSEAIRNIAHGHNNTQLAESLGFSSADSFGHWFRRLTGVSPSQFRAQHEHRGRMLSQPFDRMSCLISTDGEYIW